MKVIKKIILSDEESKLFDKFYALLRDLQNKVFNENLKGLFADISELKDKVANLRNNFDEE